MNFKYQIMKYELSDFDKDYISKSGETPVIITAVHTMDQHKKSGIKKAESFTKGISEYIANTSNSSYYIKLKDNGIESNSAEVDEFKENLLNKIKEKKIKLLLDIHGANRNRDFDVELGTLNNLSAKFSTIKALEKAFIEHGITNIKFNDPFKGGGITKYIYSNTDIDVIQIEINKKFREYDNFDDMEKLCNALISFINYYSSKNK